MAREGKRVTISLGAEDRELLENAIEAHISTITKIHTLCMKQKAMEAAKDLHGKIKRMERQLKAVRGEKLDPE